MRNITINRLIKLSRTPDVKLSDRHLLMKLKQEAIGHLSSVDIDYFLHWCKLLMIEGNEGSDGNKRKDLWTVPVDIRFTNFFK